MSLSDWYQTAGIPKPEPRRKLQAREDRKAAKSVKDVRAYVFGRERGICRCCRWRPAESMHEIKPRGAGGKVSKANSIAVCGQLVGTDLSCHTFLQLEQIHVGYGIRGAEDVLHFTPETEKAAEFLKIKPGEQISSPPMGAVETE